MLAKLIAAGVFSPLDALFAERVLARAGGVATLPCHVFLAVMLALSRRGHVSVELSCEQLLPLCASAPHLIDEIVALSKEGAKSLDQTLIAEEKGLLRYSAPNYYLQKNWLCEAQVLSNLKRLNVPQPHCPVIEEGPLNPEQRQAVIQGIRSSLSFITGGPGTGKTYTAAHLVRACMQSMDPISQFRVILTAPTGKAVTHLHNNLLKFLTDPLPSIKSGTLHALLEVRANKRHEDSPPALIADLIIVDECSMIDAPLFARLCSAVIDGSRLVLIGDPDQLPPVEAGSFFADLVDSKRFPVTHLRQCLRMESQEILTVADRIREGDVPAVMDRLQSDGFVKRENFSMSRGNEARFATLLSSYVRDRFPHFSPTEPEAETLLATNSQFRILCGMRQGPFGADAINQILYHHYLSSCTQAGFLAIPILITRNDYALQLYNGDTGFLIKRIEKNAPRVATGEFALFGKRKIAALALPPFEFAYCLSVHKSQGSEYDEILLLMPEGAENFGREVLYTAITRARKKVAWDGSLPAIESAVRSSSRKTSGLLN